MKLIFVRHGESTGNAGLPSFDLARIALTELGHIQARAVAEGWQVPPDLIATSPFLRTQQTAAPTQARFPQAPSTVLPMQEFTYLEPSRWSGSTREQRLPFIQAYWRLADPMHCDGPGAESYAALLDRIQATLRQLAALPDGALVYAFGHGQFMQALRLTLLFPHWSAQEQMRCFWPFNEMHPILNTARIEIERQAQSWRVVAPPGAFDAASLWRGPTAGWAA